MKLDISEKEGILTGRISGRFDTLAAKEVDMKPFLDNADKTLCFDCTEMDFISSAGLRHFLALYNECRAKGGSIVLKGIVPDVMRVFKVAGFTSFFTFE